MTAPDDVRARFAAHHGITWDAIQSLPIGSGSRIHLESHYKRHFETWQAAHADMAGEIERLTRGDIGYAQDNVNLIAAAPILLQELRGANTQMEMAAECIEAGRYDEARSEEHTSELQSPLN